MMAIIYPKLEHWMVDNRMNEKRLAAMIPASHTTVRNWLHGRTDMPLATARRLSDITGINMDELFQTKESRPGTAIPKAASTNITPL
ncbi:helix-turn-helix domain-containing protein [Butyricicoccus faecihominis]|uniref:helix-turn-helix domain-containing protein n=1 Tax=Butyricicoccus faecihominis TaxID=1712515 RepID=UPI002478B6E7|nr:helix-turn-helix transcriptional regulator [Butyricicoccus faecihominis]MCQ5130321.1 helix-turn-helix domain-containing protein [Butyricicoccus faecihominis]